MVLVNLTSLNSPQLDLVHSLIRSFLAGSDEISLYSNSPTSPNGGTVLLSPNSANPATGGHGHNFSANNIPLSSITNGAVPSSQSVQQFGGNVVISPIGNGSGGGAGGGAQMSGGSAMMCVAHSQSAHQLGLQQQQQQQQLSQQQPLGAGTSQQQQQSLHQQLQQHFAAAAAAAGHSGNNYGEWRNAHCCPVSPTTGQCTQVVIATSGRGKSHILYGKAA